MSDSLSFKYILTEGDAVSAFRFQAFRSKLLWVLWGLFILMVAYTFYHQIQAVWLGHRAWSSLLRTVLSFGALGVAWFAFNWFYPYWTARRWPAVGVEKEVTVSDEGMTTRSPLGYSESAWANFTGVLETDEFFLLQMGRANFLPIPKRDLAKISAVSDFRELLRAQFTDYRRA